VRLSSLVLLSGDQNSTDDDADQELLPMTKIPKTSSTLCSEFSHFPGIEQGHTGGPETQFSHWVMFSADEKVTQLSGKTGKKGSVQVKPTHVGRASQSV